MENILISAPETKKDSAVESYRKNAEWGLEHPTVQVRDLASLLKSSGQYEGEIIDAGAGFGRNSVFLAQEGFTVRAIEINRGAIPDLETTVKEGRVENKIVIENKPVQEALKDITDNSIVAIVDSGMSHYLNNEEKEEFAKNASRVLKSGGYITVLHFSENEESNPQWGRSRRFLEKLFPEDKFEITRDWKEIKWTHKDFNKKHSAWTVTLRKK